jgi:hypothetical protein
MYTWKEKYDCLQMKKIGNSQWYLVTHVCSLWRVENFEQYLTGSFLNLLHEFLSKFTVVETTITPSKNSNKYFRKALGKSSLMGTFPRKDKTPFLSRHGLGDRV